MSRKRLVLLSKSLTCTIKQRIICITVVEWLWIIWIIQFKKDTIQNFQLDSVRFLTYSWNISFIWSARWRVTGTPVAGSWAWHWLRGKSQEKYLNLKYKNKLETTITIQICEPVYFMFLLFNLNQNITGSSMWNNNLLSLNSII